MSLRSFADEDTHFRIVPSGSPPSVDGLAITEPKFLECTECGARADRRSGRPPDDGR